MAEGERVYQQGMGHHVAQATGGAKAIVEDRRTIQTIYQFATPQPIEEVVLAKAEARLAELPVDTVPDPAGLPPGSLIPFTHNALFVGRTDDLKMLAAALKEGSTAAVGQSAAVTGLGGIGKTQLASEFVYRYGRYFAGGVFWLSFANPDAIAAEIATCGASRALNLHPDFGNLPLDVQVGMVASAWHSDLPRLLVFDNCEDEVLLVTWAPRSDGCRVLVTSRRGAWSADLGVRAVPLGVLARQESVALLCKHRPDRALDDPELAAIAAELGDLPLALHLAGSFLKKYQHAPQGQPEAYLAAVRRPDVLAHKSLTLGGRSPTGHEQHVARTFALSYEGLKAEEDVDAAALTVLARAAWFAPSQPVPRDLLAASAGVEAENEAVRLLYEDALARLIELGLLEEERDGALVLHRLLAVFVRSVSNDSVTAREAVEATVWAEAWQISERGYPAPLLAWQPHLRAVADEAEQAGSARASGLFNRLGYHLRMVADFPGARQAFERALRIEERTFGPNHPNVAREVNNLGGVLQVLGDLAGARAACERALAIGEKVYEPNHPEMALYVNNLGNVLRDLGDLIDARQAFERALAVMEVYKPDHPQTATCLGNLGSVLQALGDLAGARQALERALAIEERAFGPDHPNVARTVNNVGLVLQDLYDLAGARAAFERALAINERTFGPDHPDVAHNVNNLGQVLQALGNPAGARQAFERALATSERVFGPDHPNVARAVNNLGMVLRDLDDLTGARQALERALRIDERTLGPDHFEVATDASNLGTVLRDLGDLTSARLAFERALRIDERSFGPNHPNVARDVNNLGRVLQDLGDLSGARQALERALAIMKVYQPDHPETAACLGNLGSVLRDLGDLSGARQALERALAIEEKVYEPDHPEMAICLNNLGSVLRDLGDLSGARAVLERALTIMEKAFGPDHSQMAICLSNLWPVLQALGDISGARAALERALAIRERTFGSHHPDVAYNVNNLGGVLLAMNDLFGARAAFKRALAITEKALGPNHPDVAVCLINLGGVLRDLNDLAGARAAFERALAIGKKALGPDHPSTRIVRANLASLSGRGEGKARRRRR